ncbi:MAG TPA: hypothetical protein VND94_16965 [Terriglobia bacterium]|nr:hypothetical protein [Terriglobia bacterium]
MNRDISQLIAVLMQMQADIGSQRTGLAALAKEISRLAVSIGVLDADRLVAAVTTAAAEASAAPVARAADSAEAASKVAEVIAALTAPESRRKRRWRWLALVMILLGCLVVGAVGGRFISLTRPTGCVMAGGEWVSKPTASGCVLH